MNLSHDLKRIAAEAYFVTPAMIRFLLIENLALKNLLHEKGLMTPEEYAEHQKKATEILDAKVDEQLKEYIKKLAASRSKVADV